MDEISVIPEELKERLNTAIRMVFSRKDTVRVISHYDADGICAAGIMCLVLDRKDIKFHASLSRSLSDEYVNFLKNEDYPLYIFCDMGSGHLDSFSDFSGEVIVLDHHVALKDSQNPLLINPHLFGMNGTDEICASSLSFYLQQWQMMPTGT